MSAPRPDEEFAATATTDAPDTLTRVELTDEWRWFSKVRAVIVELESATQPTALAIAGSPGFIRIVDRDTLVIDLPVKSLLHRALSQPGRRPGVVVWCRFLRRRDKFVRLDGIGSVGPAGPDTDRDGHVCFRITTATASLHDEDCLPGLALSTCTESS